MARENLNIYKIGGNVINDSKVLQNFLNEFSKLGGNKILVHGGGNKASELTRQMGINPKMIGGRRITDKETLEIVIMTYAGLLNKKIVSQLQQYDCNAIGLSGADANTMMAHKRIVRDIDYGFAGDIDSINTTILEQFLDLDLTPVFCAITHDKKGQLLNTNADTIAAELSKALTSSYDVTLNYIFEHDGVLDNIDDKNSVISLIDLNTYQKLIDENKIADGMLPKLHNCFDALNNGVTEIRIGNEKLVQGGVIHTKLKLKS